MKLIGRKQKPIVIFIALELYCILSKRELEFKRMKVWALGITILASAWAAYSPLCKMTLKVLS